MKLLVNIFFAMILVIPAFSQSGQLAKSEQQYTKMYRSSKVKMARSHAEFYAQAKKNKVLWKYFKDRKFALSFLKKMNFSRDGLRTIDLMVPDKQFEEAVGKTLGFDRDFWMSMRKGYCCGEDRECEACSAHSKCLRSCDKAKVVGDGFNPEKVLGGR